MVDVNKIHNLLNYHFTTRGDVSIDPASGQVHVSGNVELTSELSQLPVSFGRVDGDFWCQGNKLTSLQGAPVHVGGAFWCHDNKLTSLQGAPRHVHENFWCHRNKLISLQGAPDHVGGVFWCRSNKLTSLQGAPRHVGAAFLCSHNQLTTLHGAPDHVGGALDCSDNPLNSLQGASAHVGGRFVCIYNKQLPLLRLIMYTSIQLIDAPDAVNTIMQKYAGKGKTHMLNLALELKQAGFVGNAAW